MTTSTKPIFSTTKIKNADPFAEIMESSLQLWKAQSWQWDTFPPFGSLVTITTNQRTLFGIVHQIQTGSLDPVRYPFPYQKTEEELLREQPQIFEFIKTTFSCVAVGYLEHGIIHHLIAPEPPKIHSFVQLATKEQTLSFFTSNNYLHLLASVSSQIGNLDELLLALLKHLNDANLLTPTRMNDFIETFSLTTGNDYRRLKIFLLRQSSALHS